MAHRRDAGAPLMFGLRVRVLPVGRCLGSSVETLSEKASNTSNPGKWIPALIAYAWSQGLVLRS